MRPIITIFLLGILFLTATCKDPEAKSPAAALSPKVDNTWREPDPLQLKRFLELNQGPEIYKQALLFYEKRNYRSAWITQAGINEWARTLIGVLDHEKQISKTERSALLEKLHDTYRRFSAKHCQGDSCSAKLEVLLTLNFFEYARRNWNGADDEVLKKVNWYIVRKHLNYEQLLSEFLASARPASLNEPVYRQYGLLKQQLRNYYEIGLLGGWSPLPEGLTKLEKGDTSAAILLIKQQLRMTGDLPENINNQVFDDPLEMAVKRFQARHGLKQDGVVGGETLQALRVPVQERISQIQINMERCRWIPAQIGGDYLVVNIPQFQLQAYRNNEPCWSCNVIVGKTLPMNNTVIFNDSIEYIVFSPYWNIPQNILSKEILPKIKSDSSYLVRNNMEVVNHSGKVNMDSINWKQYRSHVPYTIRERPGRSNSLGRIKFLFPNSYDIYMHDTPARSLFSKSVRTFSHGCIRLEEPAKLAGFLLGADSAWTPEKIEAAMAGGKETFVKLKNKVPVFITYFTAWVDNAGKINFRTDVYGHDARMRQVLVVN
jgi:murein L,D-transpeptidase YcbB/YkuD